MKHWLLVALLLCACGSDSAPQPETPPDATGALGPALARHPETPSDATGAVEPALAQLAETETDDGGAIRLTPARNTEAQSKTTCRPLRGRRIPAAVRRAVWSRDRARCTFVDERGRRCGETNQLEFHHKNAHARGGPATVANIQLRCRAHNDLAAEQDFGPAYMSRMRTKRVG